VPKEVRFGQGILQKLRLAGKEANAGKEKGRTLLRPFCTQTLLHYDYETNVPQADLMRSHHNWGQGQNEE